MNRFGIIGAMDEEVDILVEQMDVDRKHEFAGLVFHEGKISGKDCVLVRCGIAKVNAALCTQILIDKFDVDCVINTGVAGAVSDELDVNHLVISEDAIQYDVDASAFGDPVGTIPRMDTSVFVADERLVKAALDAAKELGLEDYHHGRIVTGDKFVGSKELKKYLKDEFGGYCCEMEGGAIAHVCHVNSKPFVIIRAISDNADGEAGMTYDEFLGLACEKSKSLVMKMLEKIN